LLLVLAHALKLPKWRSHQYITTAQGGGFRSCIKTEIK
jgi:hypothetical protein